MNSANLEKFDSQKLEFSQKRIFNFFRKNYKG